MAARQGAAVAAPARRPAARPRTALPAPRRLPAAPAVRQRGAEVLDALLVGKAWIVLVAVLLAGIVFFNVDLLQLNREIARTSERSSEVERRNARLRLELARIGSSERIQRVAEQRGLILPAPGDVRYLSVRAADPRLAVGNAREPGDFDTQHSPVGKKPEAPAPTSDATPTPATGTTPTAPTPAAPVTTPPAAVPQAPAVPAPAPAAPVTTPTG